MILSKDYLFHWTGKNICKDSRELTTENETKYINLLWNILTNGLNFKNHHNNIEDVVMGNSSMICFTEISPKGDDITKHSSTYGLMGLGFKKDFILKKTGCPVLYLSKKGHSEYLNTLLELLDFLKSNNKKLYGEFSFFFGLMKQMQSEQPYDFYDEREWRIVLTNSNKKEFQNQKNSTTNESALLICPKDIDIIIFPNKSVLNRAILNENILSWFKGNLPSFVTFEELANL